ncbi:hypothetical protein WR25_19376 [Diploscapter pachys]|uniref:Gelsolin-like domain-containing protein n=1 Tax=Diploscapter pachys TaxID=2018661 RepID=A0A2A2KEY0_9BILA|nr:hypothetical protein WR25_19376 [Diploscapter pachys]
MDLALANLGKEVGLRVWRINKLALEEVPKSKWGIFYTGDAYIVLNMLGGFPTQHREVQNFESGLFLSYFPDGIRYVSGGYESGFEKVEDMFKNWKPKLFHCKGKRNVRCTQVECKKESLNKGDVFILDLGRDIYVWMPPDSGRLERIRGMGRAKHMAHVERCGASKAHVLDSDWDTNPDFWCHFGGINSAYSITPAKNDDDNFWKRTNEQVTLWRVSNSTGQLKVSKVATGNLKLSMLDSKDAFILDSIVDGVYVFVGRECTLDERSKACHWGQTYLKQQNLPLYTQITRVLETAEPASFLQWFGDFQEEKEKHEYKPRLYQVSDESGRMIVEEVANFTQEDLDGDDVMILDAINLIYVWVGTEANPKEKQEATNTAKKYLEKGSMPRHKNTAIETVYQGQEPPTFKKFFPNWNDSLFKNQTRSLENMRRLLFSN